MEISVIKEMLADPNIDPSSWFDNALVEWLVLNSHTLMDDEHARKYIIKGMTFDSANTLFRNLDYSNSTVVEELIVGFKECLRKTINNKSYISSYTISHMMDKFEEKRALITKNAISKLCELPLQNIEHSFDIFKHISINDTNTILINQNLRYNYIRDFIFFVDSMEIYNILRKNIKYYIDGHLTLEKLRLFIYAAHESHYDEIKTLLCNSEIYKGYTPPKKQNMRARKITDLLCGCGYFATNKLGLSIHKNSCDIVHPGLINLINLLSNNSDACKQCGSCYHKSCKHDYNVLVNNNVKLINEYRECLKKFKDKSYTVYQLIYSNNDDNDTKEIRELHRKICV